MTNSVEHETSVRRYIGAGLFTVIKTQMVAGDEGFYPAFKKNMHRIPPPVRPQPHPVLQHVLQRSHLGFISLVFPPAAQGNWYEKTVSKRYQKMRRMKDIRDVCETLTLYHIFCHVTHKDSLTLASMKMSFSFVLNGITNKIPRW